MKSQKHILTLESPTGIVMIKENVEYVWCKQHGFFKQEDDDLFAWYPGTSLIGTGTPSYFAKRNILNISDNYNSFPTPNKN